MSFLLKIVEGPNKGAEIALVDGVAVTLGKGDDCDIVLADPTMPAEPLSIEAGPGGVTAGGEPLEPFHVKTLGATSFAVGPADAPWGELRWPGQEGEDSNADGQESEPPAAGPAAAAGPATPAAAPAAAPDSPEEAPSRPRRRLLVRVIAPVLLLVVLACLLRSAVSCFSGAHGEPGAEGDTGSSDSGVSMLGTLAGRYGLAVEEDPEGGAAKVSGNFATRRERLAATAEFYAAHPGVDLDLSDDESLLSAAEDTLAMLSEPNLHVAVATNRVLALSGNARDIRRVMAALAADLPKLRDVDVSEVSLAGEGGAVGLPGGEAPAEDAAAAGKAAARPGNPAAQRSLPVCGILTAPYPCLVLRSGARVLEGAPLGDGVVLKIDADSVTITNSAGLFTWRP